MATNKFSLYSSQAITSQKPYHTITIIIPEVQETDKKTDERIIHQGVVITGILQENFGYSLAATWEQVIKVGGFSDTIETAMLLTGNKVQNAGGITKQYYKGSEYITIPAKFRIYSEGDDENKLSLMQIVSALSKVMVPATGNTIQSWITGLEKTAKTVIATTEQLATNLAKGQGLAALGKAFDKLTGDVGGTVCQVQFGNWMVGQFVLASVGFEYSKEVTTNGEPYFVDIDCSFRSFMIPVKSNFSVSDNDSSNSVASLKLLAPSRSRVSIK